MGQFKDVGNPELALMEEMAEAIQVISKKLRFNSCWRTIPEGKTLTRWEDLTAEMEDVLYQWERLKKYKDDIDGYQSLEEEEKDMASIADREKEMYQQ